ncbi:MAG: PAS domain S-box protein, partial [Halalkalicoccus sp.]
VQPPSLLDRVRAPPADEHLGPELGEFESGGERYFTGVIRDVTDRKRRRAELEATHERLEDTLSRIGDAFFAVDTDWRFTYVNEKAETLLERSAEELLGENVWEEFPEAMTERFYEEYHRAMETGEVVTFEEYFEPLSTWFDVRAYPSADGLSVYFQDVTERKLHESLLTDLLETSRALMHAETPEEIARTVVDTTGETLGFGINAVHLDRGDRTLEAAATTDRTRELIGDLPTYGPGDGVVGEAFAAGEARIYADARAADGFEYGPVRSSMVLPLGEHGTLSVGALEPDAFDETDVRIAELLTASARAALDRTERDRELRRYETVLETVQEMVYALDPDGRCVMATEPLADRMGYDRESVIGRRAGEILDPVAVEQGRTVISRLLSEPELESETYETMARTADGERFPVEVEISLLFDDGEFAGTVGVLRDISELERARRELDDERDRFTYLFETLPDPVDEVVVEGGETIVRGVNEAFERTFGYDEATLVGSPLPEEIGAPGVEKEETVELTTETTTGTRQFLFRRVPYERDDRTHAFGIYTDITEQKDRERQLKVLHRVLRHNLRNGLNVVTAAANQLIAADCIDDRRRLAAVLEERVEELVDLSEDAAMIERTIDGRDDSHEIDAVAAIEPVIAAYEDELAIDAELPDSLSVAADHRLGAVVSNLFDNVIEHAAPTDGDLGDERPPVDVWLRRTGGVAELTVADDGPGIPDLERELLSGAREITQLEHGSGLGLWLVKWTVESYGGHVSFEDGPGTTVVLSLPLADDINRSEAN